MKRQQKFLGRLLMTTLIFFCDAALGVPDTLLSPTLTLLESERRTNQQLRERISSLNSEVSRLKSENQDLQSSLTDQISRLKSENEGLEAKIYRLNAWRWAGGAVIVAVIAVNVLLLVAVGGRKPHFTHQTVVVTKCPQCGGNLDDGTTRCAECGCVI